MCYFVTIHCLDYCRSVVIALLKAKKGAGLRKIDIMEAAKIALKCEIPNNTYTKVHGFCSQDCYIYNIPTTTHASGYVHVKNVCKRSNVYSSISFLFIFICILSISGFVIHLSSKVWRVTKEKWVFGGRGCFCAQVLKELCNTKGGVWVIKEGDGRPGWPTRPAPSGKQQLDHEPTLRRE